MDMYERAMEYFNSPCNTYWFWCYMSGIEKYRDDAYLYADWSDALHSHMWSEGMHL